ncbi:MAG: hypothetical protein OEM41_07245 [Ignavibacteria bacterium]|nr:hypothetical protein [Ignavibacteria bacterium]
MKMLAMLLLFCIPTILVAQVPSTAAGLPPVNLTPEKQVSSLPFGDVTPRYGAGNYSHILGFASVTDFGFAGRTYFSLGTRAETTPELSVGFIKMNSSSLPPIALNGYIYSQGLFILPVYVGVRYNLYEDRTSSFEWSWYVRGGGGPAVGMLTPVGLGFFDSLNRMTFHFGAGAYAATGLEFIFNEYMTFFIQGGADYVGFFSEVGSRQNFVGPTLSIGFGKLLP